VKAAALLQRQTVELRDLFRINACYAERVTGFRLPYSVLFFNHFLRKNINVLCLKISKNTTYQGKFGLTNFPFFNISLS